MFNIYLKMAGGFFALFFFQSLAGGLGGFMSEGMLFVYNFSFMMNMGLDFSFFVDKWGLFFSITVSFISMNVLFFSKSYMSGELYSDRFVSLMFLFILSMNLLIFFPNLIFLMLGWDGLGLVSFLLVIHYQTPGSLAAGYITVLSNRIGDVLILLSIPLFLSVGGFMASVNLESASVFGLMVMLAAMTKSAQMPFSSWLPAAMAAPTPISALVHSSTLVTAGVYLIFRFYPMLSLSVWFHPILLVCSSMTMLMAGLGAFMETDMKKVVALSTLSQLGVMMYSLSVGLPELAFFHLVSHATFKALLFIGVGKLISQYSHNQDFRLIGMGGGWNLGISVANLSLAGFPFLAGYYSKDLIIETSMGGFLSTFLFVVLVFSTVMTLVYSYRMMKFLYSGSNWSEPLVLSGGGDWWLDFSIVLMTTYVLISGSYLSWGLLFPYPHPIMSSMEKFFLFMAFTFILIVMGVFDDKYLSFLKMVGSRFIYSMWYLNYTNSQFMLMLGGQSGKLLYETFDSGWNEKLVGKGSSNLVGSLNSGMLMVYGLGAIGLLISLSVYMVVL